MYIRTYMYIFYLPFFDILLDAMFTLPFLVETKGVVVKW